MALSKETILRATDRGMSVFRHFISFPFQVGRSFLNPLYEDKRASCNIYLDRKSDCYRLKDFGNDDYSGDCFAFVGKLFGLDCSRPTEFVQIMEKISSELHLGLYTDRKYSAASYTPRPAAVNRLPAAPPPPTSPPAKKAKTYRIEQKNFSASELAWWKSYGITEAILQSFHVASLNRFDSENREGKPFYFVSTEKEPLYGGYATS